MDVQVSLHLLQLLALAAQPALDQTHVALHLLRLHHDAYKVIQVWGGSGFGARFGGFRARFEGFRVQSQRP